MSEAFVLIRSYPWSLSEAQLAKVHLESYGIAAQLQNQLMIGTGRVQLLVKHTNVEQASKILKLGHDISPRDESLESDGMTDLANHDPAELPEPFESVDRRGQASATRVMSRLRSITKMFIWLFLGFCGLYAVFMFTVFAYLHWEVLILTVLLTGFLLLIFRKSRSMTSAKSLKDSAS